MPQHPQSCHLHSRHSILSTLPILCALPVLAAMPVLSALPIRAAMPVILSSLSFPLPSLSFPQFLAGIQHEPLLTSLNPS